MASGLTIFLLISATGTLSGSELPHSVFDCSFITIVQHVKKHPVCWKIRV